MFCNFVCKDRRKAGKEEKGKWRNGGKRKSQDYWSWLF